jgi:hypothetical protein
MKTSDCIKAAKNDLANARRYLESGAAVNWVADNFGSERYFQERMNELLP